MASKVSKSKTVNKSEKPDQRARQLRWTRLIFGIFAVLLVVSMLLSLLVKY